MRRSSRTSRDGGYVLAFTIVIFPFLIGVTAMAVDIGTWYVQAQANQRAADAAALAGVVWLPDETKAKAAALAAAQHNGKVDGVNATVIVERAGPHDLRVKVGTESRQFFSQLFVSPFAITRSAVGRHVPPVALGSPKNSLGTGNLPGFAPADGFWLAVSGRCSVAENGDLRLASFSGSYDGVAGPPFPTGYPPRCSGGTNPSYKSDGYLFAIDVPADLPNRLFVDVFDATYAPGAYPYATDIEFARVPASAPSEFRTRFTLYNLDGSVHSTTTVAAGDPDWGQTWRDLPRINAPRAGTYYLRVETLDSTGSDSNGSRSGRSFGSNGFALRTRVGSTSSTASFADCSTILNPTTCINVYAVSDLPVYASISGTTTSFYLAEIDGSHAGKTLEISLFDVGEGAELIEILDPDGNPATFAWETDCTTVASVTPPCSGTASSLDVSPTSQPQPGSNRMGTSRFNDRTVVLKIALPRPYGYTGKWWKVRYTAGAVMTDRTTWSVRVVGDPVRLAD